VKIPDLNGAPASKTPDVIGKVRAYRTFTLGKDGTLKTRSALTTRIVYKSDKYAYPVPVKIRWKHGANRAICNRVTKSGLHLENQWKHDTPVMECSCGFYGSTDPRSEAILGVGGRHVLAVADYWGGIVYHEKNGVLRSQFAEAVAVAIPPKYIAEREEFRLKYPYVKIFDTPLALAEAYPPEVPSYPPSTWRRFRKCWYKMDIVWFGLFAWSIASMVTTKVSILDVLVALMWGSTLSQAFWKRWRSQW